MSKITVVCKCGQSTDMDIEHECRSSETSREYKRYYHQVDWNARCDACGLHMAIFYGWYAISEIPDSTMQNWKSRGREKWARFLEEAG